MKKTKEVTAAGRTLLVKGPEGEFKITIPAGARVTFGPTIPFTPRNTRGGFGEFNPGGGYSLRVYENATNTSLIAVFAGVQGFRDITMPHAKLVIREAGKAVWKSDEEGYKVEQEVKHTKGFEEFKLLEE